MPHPKRMIVKYSPEGLVGVPVAGHHKKEVPIGIMVDDQPMLLLRFFEDERESCDHCGALFAIGDSGDDDERCGRCNKSHRECQGCDRSDAETCIHCDTDWCETCWTSSAHLEDCEVTRKKVAKDVKRASARSKAAK